MSAGTNNLTEGAQEPHQNPSGFLPSVRRLRVHSPYLSSGLPLDVIPRFDGLLTSLETWFTAIRNAANKAAGGVASEDFIIKLAKDSLSLCPSPREVGTIFNLPECKKFTCLSEYEALCYRHLFAESVSDPYTIFMHDLTFAAPTEGETLTQFSARLCNLLNSFMVSVNSSTFMTESRKVLAPSYGKIAALSAIRRLLPPSALAMYSVNPPTMDMEPLEVLLRARSFADPGSFPPMDFKLRGSAMTASNWLNISEEISYSNLCQENCYKCGKKRETSGDCPCFHSKRYCILGSPQTNAPYCTIHMIHGHDTSECLSVYHHGKTFGDPISEHRRERGS